MNILVPLTVALLLSVAAASLFAQDGTAPEGARRDGFNRLDERKPRPDRGSHECQPVRSGGGAAAALHRDWRRSERGAYCRIRKCSPTG